MLCGVCGARAVVMRGRLDRPTHTECTFCGSHDCAKADQTECLGPAPGPSHVAGGVMLSASELDYYESSFGPGALEELLGRGPGV